MWRPGAHVLLARLRQLSPSQAVVAPIVALHLVSWAAIVVATVQRLHQYVPSAWGPVVVQWSIVTIVATAIVLAVVWVARGRRALDRLAGTAFKPYMMALAGGILLVIVPLFLLFMAHQARRHAGLVAGVCQQAVAARVVPVDHWHVRRAALGRAAAAVHGFRRPRWRNR
jgi:hypothetical protein